MAYCGVLFFVVFRRDRRVGVLRRGLLGKVSILRALLQPKLVLRGWGSRDFQVRGGFALLVRVLATLPV